MHCVNRFWGESQAQKSTRINENYYNHLALVSSLQEMCLDETWRERNQVLWGGAFLGGAALPVLCVAQGHGREGTMVTDTRNSGFTLECCLNCQLYPKPHLEGW